MKKIILIFLAMFWVSFVNANEINVKLEWVPNVYYNYEKDGLLYWGQVAYIYVDGGIAYCLDITKPVNSSTYKESDEIQDNNLIKMAGYFGYGYDNNIDLKDYIATQKLIWSFLGTDVYFTTLSNGNGKVIDIFENESRIRNLINTYQVFPFYNDTFVFVLGTNNYLEQINNTNFNYDIINNSNNSINFYDKGLFLVPNEVGKNKFYLKTNLEKRVSNQIYEADNSQKLMVIGEIDNLSREYPYEVVGGTISLQLILDKMNGISKYEDNIFSLYKDDVYIGDYVSDSNGKLIIGNLGIGNYKVCHDKVMEGYYSNDYEYFFEISQSRLDYIDNIYLYLKKINVIVNKTVTFPLTNEVVYDDSIVYSVFDSNNNIIFEGTTDEEGKVYFNLEYGNYKISQSNINKSNVVHDDFEITKEMFTDDIIYNINDDVYKVKIKVKTYDSDGSILPNVNFVFDDISYNTDEEGVFITDLLDFGEYTLSDIMIDGYSELDDFNYILDENCDIYIEDSEAYVDINLYFKKNITIDESNDNLEDLDDALNDTDDKNVNIEIDNESEVNKDESETINNSFEEDDYVNDNLNDDKLPFLGTNGKKSNKIIRLIYFLRNIIFML